MKIKNSKKNSILFTILMVIIFFLITELLIWGYGSSILLAAITNYPKGELVITEAVLASLVLIVMLLFRNGYVFTQKHEKLTKGLFYGSYFIIGASVFILVYRSGLKEGLAVLNLAVGCFLVGLSEELLCRGWLLNEFLEKFGNTKKGVWYSIIVSGVIFGLIHLGNVLTGQAWSTTIIQALTAIVAGIFFGVIYYKTKNIWSVILLHALWDFSLLLSEIIPIKSETVVLSSFSIIGLVFSLGMILSECISIIPFIKDIDKEPEKESVIVCAIIGFTGFLFCTILSSFQTVSFKDTYNYNPIHIKNFSVTTNNYQEHFIKEENYYFKLYKDGKKLIFQNMNNNKKKEWLCEDLKDFIIIKEKDNYIIGFLDYLNHNNYFLRFIRINKEELKDTDEFLEKIDQEIKEYLLPEDLRLLEIHNRDDNNTYLAAYDPDYGYYVLTNEDKIAYLERK